MRVWLAILMMLVGYSVARGDERAPRDQPPADKEPGAPVEFVWAKAFAPISARESDRLALVVITNDDASLGDQPPWCTRVFSRALAGAYESRPDLRERMSVQSLRVGMPAVLTGGTPSNGPARAIVALCDGGYQLLGFTVGVPDSDGLLSLIEDAQEVQSLMQMHRESRKRLIDSIAQRSAGRISRRWSAALQEMMISLGDGNFEDSADVPDALAQQQAGRLSLLCETYRLQYFADVKLRFGLTEASDVTRLVVLEQHPQARRPWRECMIPFLAAEDFHTLWSPLCESLWGVQPIRVDAEDPELLDWWDSQIDTSAVVFSLLPALPDRRQPWPPVADDGKSARRGLGWQDVQTLVVKRPYRSIDAQQLALLMRARDLKPIDIHRPSLARYLMFEPNRTAALVVRQNDPPGRFVGRLKRDK